MSDVGKMRETHLPVRDQLAAFLKMVGKQTPADQTLHVKRINIKVEDNKLGRTEFDSQVDIDGIKKVLQQFDVAEKSLLETAATFNYLMKTTKMEHVIFDDPSLFESTRESPDWKNENENTYAHAINLLHESCAEARRHMAYSDFLPYSSLPLLLEGLTIEAIHTLVDEAKNAPGSNAVGLWKGLLRSNSSLNNLFTKIAMSGKDMRNIYSPMDQSPTGNHGVTDISQILDTQIKKITMARTYLKKQCPNTNVAKLAFEILEAIDQVYKGMENDNLSNNVASLLVARVFAIRSRLLQAGWEPMIKARLKVFVNNINSAQQHRNKCVKDEILIKMYQEMDDNNFSNRHRCERICTKLKEDQKLKNIGLTWRAIFGRLVKAGVIKPRSKKEQ